MSHGQALFLLARKVDTTLWHTCMFNMTLEPSLGCQLLAVSPCLPYHRRAATVVALLSINKKSSYTRGPCPQRARESMGMQTSSCLLSLVGGSLHVPLEGIGRQKGPQQLKVFTRLSGDMNVRVGLAGCLKAKGKAVRIGVKRPEFWSEREE